MENKEESLSFKKDFSSVGSWLKRHRVISGLGICVLLIIVFQAIAPAAQPETNTNDMSPAEKLARVETQDPNPPASVVALYDAMLTKLATKCPNNSRDQLAGYVFTMKKDIVGKTTFLEDGEDLYKSIPNSVVGTLKCDEATAALVTLTNDPNLSSQ